MIRLRAALWDRLVTGAVVGLVAAFIGADVLDSSGWDWRQWIAALRERLSPAAVDTSEIRDYVEFATVTHDGFDVVTGVRFDSSWRRAVVKQWCYVEPVGDGIAKVTLTLANKFGNGQVIANTLTGDDVAPLGITVDQAGALLHNQCRFRD